MSDIYPTPVLSAENLRFSYGNKSVVDIPSFQLGAEQSMAVIGPSGCGKTTFLHLLAGLLKPTAGSVVIKGEDIFGMSLSALDRFRGKHIGMVFQRLFLLPAISVRENIALAQKMARQPVDAKRIQSLIDQLGLTDVAKHKPRMLSQGQAQRVAIARALIHDPALVLADEPTSALDDERATDALALLKESAQAAGASLLVVTHDQRVRGQLDTEFEMEAQP